MLFKRSTRHYYKSTNHNFLVIISFFITCILLFSIILYLNNLIINNRKISKLVRPVLYQLHLSVLGNKNSSGLEKLVNKVLQNDSNNYGVVIKNLATGEEYNLNEHKQFETASLYKLWVMGLAYQEISEGKLKKNEFLSQDASILNNKFNIPSDSADIKDGVVSYTLSDAVNRMITVSDNYTALLLTEKLKLSKLAQFLKDNNFYESNIGSVNSQPVSSASDIALFYEKLYENKLINADSSAGMLSLLKEQKINTKLPRYLPPYVKTAHKTGERDSFSHDAGIVFLPDNEYVLVVLSDTDNPSSANENIAKISEAVYQYFTPY